VENQIMTKRPTPAPAESPETGETHARIVEAAHRCFERHGFRKTTMDDIAREAAVARPTIYNYFPGKAEIIDHIGLEELKKADAYVRTRIGWQESFAEMATESIVSAVIMSQDNPYIRRFVEALDPENAGNAPTSSYRTEARARWRAILGRARAADELAPELDIDDVVNWVSWNIVSLLKAMGGAIADEPRLRFIARRFVVEPLLARRGD
jgi:AcrR family transcriptional regulator